MRKAAQEKCLRHRLQKRQFRPLGFSVEAEMAPATPLGERCIENWAGALRTAAVSCMLPVGPETKMEIPVETPLPRKLAPVLCLFVAGWLGGCAGGSSTAPPNPAPSQPQITVSSLANGTVGAAYSAALGATGGTPPYSWSTVTGALPAGLGLDGASGAISGTPSSAGTFSFTVQVKDSAATPQTATKPLSISVATGTPELPRVFIDTSMPVQTGSVINVPAGRDFQGALNGATCGDTIQLAAGARFVGNFTLPAKSCTGWIVIRTSAPDSSLPAQGTRITPAYANVLPKIVSPNTAPAIVTQQQANHYWFMGLEITGNPVAQPNTLYNLVLFGDGSETSLSQLPNNLVVDRCYVHGDDTSNFRRGIVLNAATIAVVDSYVSNFHEVGADSQGIAGWGGPGPFKIVNNFIQGAAENFILGGAQGSIVGIVPTDIEFRHNYVFKPLGWKVDDPSYAGIHWTVKNLFELKNAQRVLIDGNIFENNWLDGQNGFAILFTPRSSDSGPQAVVQDVTFTHNIVRHSASGMNISGHDDLDSSLPPSLVQTLRVLVKDNLFDDINGPIWGGADGRLFQVVNGASQVVFDHNTAFQSGNLVTTGTLGYTFPGFIYTNNIAPHNQYAFVGDDTSPGMPTISTYFPGSVITRNVIEAPPSGFTYPPGNFFPAAWSEVQFVDFANKNYRLAPSSPYKGAGSDGKDIGADVDAIPADVAVSK